MSFVLNDTQQISLFDSLAFLPERKQHILEKSWVKKFSDYIFKNIDEMIFAPLYSDKANSRPNTPVNIIVGALILKEFIDLSDDEMLEECECDFRYQYALHTMRFDVQPLSDRTFSRFRERNAAYELTTGIDLIHTCLSNLVKVIFRDGHTELLDRLTSYADPNHRNRVVYYEQNIPQNELLLRAVNE